MDASTYFNALLALSLVIGLVMLAGAAARRFGFMPAAGRTARRGRRLGVVEVTAVDARRRLVLVRRDGREHLLMIGGTTDLVVERDILPPGDDPSGSSSGVGTGPRPDDAATLPLPLPEKDASA